MLAGRRSLLALRDRLPRDRAPHLLREIDALDLDERDLDAPRIGMAIDDLLEALVELLALR